MDELRTNAALTAVVEHGIWLNDHASSAVAWAYMQCYDVPRSAITRVLAYPHARRQASARTVQ